MVLVTDRGGRFLSLSKYGQSFLEHLKGVQIPSQLLSDVVLVDTPGIIENRKQQERGYPFSNVMTWFTDRSDLIFVIFDPTKLDVGLELANLFQLLKGREAQVRIILNKADMVDDQELMRVYGALFWGLQPLINVTEPPRVYVGSFWDKPLQQQMHLFLREEVSLLNDIIEIVHNQLEKKIGLIRQQAILVRIHALLVDLYVKAFNKHKPVFSSSDATSADIIENPEKYMIYQNILAHNVSKYDLPDPRRYREFFSIQGIDTHKELVNHCSIFSGCPLEKIERAINVDLPALLNSVTNAASCTGSSESCSTINKKQPPN